MRKLPHKAVNFIALFILTAGLFVFLFAAGRYYESRTAERRIRINEVCSVNFSLVTDDKGEYVPYVEFRNPTPVTTAMTNMYLSDDAGDPLRFSLEGVVVPAGGYAVIWLNGSGADHIHAPFSLKKSGGSLFLSYKDGRTADSVTYPALRYNTVYARQDEQDPEADWRVRSATPGTANENGQEIPQDLPAAPSLSAESGFYDEEFLLTISAEEGTKIYYTLDGSDPDTSSFLYEGPVRVYDPSENENLYASREDLSPSPDSYVPSFPVDKAFLIRAAAADEEGRMSPAALGVYFIGYESGQRKEAYENMAVVSITADPSAFFDYETGIYVNGISMQNYLDAGGMQDGISQPSYTDENGIVHYRYEASNAYNRGRKWERESHLVFFDESHRQVLSQEAGVRIAGQSTRNSEQKSFNLFSREIYDGNADFLYPMLPGRTMDSFRLRNGGQHNDTDRFADDFLMELCRERDVAVQGSRPAVLFLNGEYWGVYGIRERYEEDYFEDHYDLHAGNLWLVDGGAADFGGEEAKSHLSAVRDQIRETDLSDENLYSIAGSLIDLQSLIDFYSINLYLSNYDILLDSNNALFRTKFREDDAFGDTRWRYALHDMDGCLEDAQADTFTDYDELEEGRFFLPRYLFANEDFRKQFVLSFMDIANTCFSYDRVHEELEKWFDLYEAQAVLSGRRFLSGDYTEEDYRSQVLAIDRFFRERKPYITDYMKDYLGLSGNLCDLEIRVNDPEGGSVQVNTARLSFPDGTDVWQGSYFTDYPVTVKAEPAEGYYFAGWQGDVSDTAEETELSLSGEKLALTAVFLKK